MEPKIENIQIETFHDGMFYPDLITFTGDFVILYEKTITDGQIVTTQKPMKLSQIVRITITRPTEIRETPKSELLTD